jgi:hypothetical protein
MSTGSRVRSIGRKRVTSFVARSMASTQPLQKSVKK